jgi:hypothetical protein
MTNRFRIEVGEDTRNSKIELNGAPLEGVCRVSFDLNPNSLTKLTLDIIGEVIVAGEFRDDAILSIRNPLPTKD